MKRLAFKEVFVHFQLSRIASRGGWIASSCILLNLGIALGQSTQIAITTTALQTGVRRLGINLGAENYYDSGQMTKNLIEQNPGFEGEIWNSTIQCISGTSTTCLDADQYAAWGTGMFDGATYHIFYGAAAGRSGTITSYVAGDGNTTGGTFTFADSGTAPANGDYMVVRTAMNGNNAMQGWWPSTYGSGAISTNTTDLPPGTAGLQTAALTAPTSSDAAEATQFFDSTPGVSFVQLNGTYQLSFKAKGTGGSNSVAVNVTRFIGTSGPNNMYLNVTVPLTGSWNTYTLTFTAAENGTAVGTVGVSWSTVDADSFELDDVSLTQSDGNPSNPTAFRDAVVSTLQALQPGTLRFWDGLQLGDTLDNWIAPQFGRQRAGFLAWYTEQDQISYGLFEFLRLCQSVGADPWIVVPSTFSLIDSRNLIDFINGPPTSGYGAKRAALGQIAPFSQSFNKIHLEFGNEAWNSTFMGGTLLFAEPYGGRAQMIFSAMRKSPYYSSLAFDLVLGGQAVNPGQSMYIQNQCNNNDSFTVAPYMMNDITSYSSNEDLFGSTFAEAEAITLATGSAEGTTGGFMYLQQQNLASSSHPTPLTTYEVNLSPLNGTITQSALNGYSSSVGGGIAVIDEMLLQMRMGVQIQNLFALPQYEFGRSDGSIVDLWGSVIDMGVTNRKRPQFLAAQLANQAISNGSTMLETVHTGSDPTWNVSNVNTVSLNGAHALQSFAFANGNSQSLIVFNLGTATALPVTFSGSNAPQGTVQMQQLTSAQITDTNETAGVVAPTKNQLSNFNPATGLSLPPFSMTVLSWQTE